METQKTIKAKDLSDEEQEAFTEHFYDIEEFDLLPEDFETSAPWGCPSEAEAKDWSEENLTADEYIEIFGEPEE